MLKPPKKRGGVKKSVSGARRRKRKITPAQRRIFLYRRIAVGAIGVLLLCVIIFLIYLAFNGVSSLLSGSKPEEQPKDIGGLYATCDHKTLTISLETAPREGDNYAFSVKYQQLGDVPCEIDTGKSGMKLVVEKVGGSSGNSVAYSSDVCDETKHEILLAKGQSWNEKYLWAQNIAINDCSKSKAEPGSYLAYIQSVTDASLKSNAVEVNVG
jgi:hypothetical protein